MGADAIVIQEDTEAEGAKITILDRAGASAGTSARPASTSRRADSPLRRRPHAHHARRGAWPRP